MMRENRLITAWRAGRICVNAWLTIPSPWVAEQMAHAGFDALTVDMQHGLIGFETAVTMMQAISTTHVVPLVRLAWNDPAAIMQMLDAGAYGLICPLISTRAQAEAFVAACRYPPVGYRSYGPTRGFMYGGPDYPEMANETILTFALIETAEAMANLDEIASTPGLNGLYIGPSDLSISLGVKKRADFTDPIMVEAVDRILAACRKYDLIPGVQAQSAANARRMAGMGFTLVTPLTDISFLKARAEEAVRETRG
jgi:4-hydroxy-2-oxoheptanedioate aldolase